MEHEEIFMVKDFIKSKKFYSYGLNIQEIMKKLLLNIDKNNANTVNYIIKVRKGNSLAFAMEHIIQKNIFTIWVYQKSIRVSVLNLLDKKLQDSNDVDEILIKAIEEKINSLQVVKKQRSIYLDEQLIRKIENASKEKKKSVNEVILDSLNEKFADAFVDLEHKIEFYKFIKDSGINCTDEEALNNMNYYSENQKRFIAFAYIVSAYQRGYKDLWGESFYYDKTRKGIGGPVYLMEECEISLEPEMIVANYILNKELSEAQYILEIFFGYYFDQKCSFVCSNALRILYGTFILYKYDIIPYKLKTLKIIKCEL